jgi:hypothetical protein
MKTKTNGQKHSITPELDALLLAALKSIPELEKGSRRHQSRIWEIEEVLERMSKAASLQNQSIQDMNAELRSLAEALSRATNLLARLKG